MHTYVVEESTHSHNTSTKLPMSIHSDTFYCLQHGESISLRTTTARSYAILWQTKLLWFGLLATSSPHGFCYSLSLVTWYLSSFILMMYSSTLRYVFLWLDTLPDSFKFSQLFFYRTVTPRRSSSVPTGRDYTTLLIHAYQWILIYRQPLLLSDSLVSDTCSLLLIRFYLVPWSSSLTRFLV